MAIEKSPQEIYAARLAALRSQLVSHNVDAIIIPSADPHQSEYVADCWATREYFSGFTGSQGTVVITQNAGGLWTDSRYFIQAPKELSNTSGLPLMKSLQGGSEYISWLVESLNEGSTVGIEGKMFTINQVEHLKKSFASKKINLKIDVDFIDAAWEDRPALPSSTLFSHDVKYAGKSAEEKLGELRAQMKQQGLTHFLMTSLDEQAWLLNYRASDIKCNPLAISFLIVGLDSCVLYTDESRIDKETKARFKDISVSIKPYASIDEDLKNIKSPQALGIDEAQTNAFLANLVDRKVFKAFKSPVRRAKAIKNEIEIGHIDTAHIKDGVALTQAFMWLENELESRKVGEAEFGSKLGDFRSKQANYYGTSFDPIVGYQGNGAIVHYRAIEGDDAQIRKSGVLLVDSGGQYHDGTTDITRTIGLGNNTAEQKKHYTLVLKGHIALDRAIFPTGTKGVQLDTFARQYLWHQGLNYGHGTGHGVGFFLNVHEPPQGITPGLGERGKTTFEAGMFTSNEPGYYLTDEYGIRLENLVLTEYAFPGRTDFLKFRAITYFPFDKNLMDKNLLTTEEIAWINNYHHLVYTKLSPSLNQEERRWLEQKCVDIW